MSPLLKRLQSVDRDVEKRIITGLIVSDKVLEKLKPFLQPNILELDLSKEIAKWLLDYHTKYKQAPKSHIKDLFLTAKQKLRPAIVEELELFLAKLSEEYLNESGPEGINEQFVIDRGLQYLKERHLKRMVGDVSALLETGEVDKAEQLAEGGKRIIQEAEYRWVKPLDDVKYLNMVFDEKENPLMEFKGKLGELVGPLYRKWLIGVMGPFKRGKCIAGDSLIQLPNGKLKPIKKVIEDKDPEVITLLPNGKLGIGKIVKYHKNGIKEVGTMITRTGGEITATWNDSFLTPNGWKHLSKIKEGDFVAIPKTIPYFGNKQLEDYKIKVLAYMLAEGSIGNMNFTNIDKKIQKDFKDSIQKLGDDVRVNPWDKITVHVMPTEPAVLGMSKTSIWFRNINLKRVRSKEKQIPDIVFELTKENLKLFLSTMFTCDGTIYKTNHGVEVSYSSASKDMIYQVSNLLLRFGIKGKISRKYDWTIRDKEKVTSFIKQIGFRFHKQDKALSFLSILEPMRDNRGFLDSLPPPIVKKLRQTIKVRKNRDWWNQTSLGLLNQCIRLNQSLNINSAKKIASIINNKQAFQIVNSDVLWDKVKKVNSGKKIPTFDLTIKKTHNFVANDIVVHNTWDLQDIGFDAVLSRKRVAFASLEMADEHQSVRLYSQIGQLGEFEKVHEVPCFDCCSNQDNSCGKSTRVSKEPRPDKFKHNQTYKPCTACRGVKGIEEDFAPTTWFQLQKHPALTRKNVRKELLKLQKMVGPNLFRLISYPAFSATLTDVEEDLERLETQEGFIPDVIIIDYADILAPETKHKDVRHQIDEIWKRLKGMAYERSCLVVSGSQGNRGSTEKEVLSEKDIAEEARKLAHADIWLALNQTAKEKERGVWRIGILEHRWRRFNKRQQLMALQHFDIGQPILDSEIIYYEYQKD